MSHRLRAALQRVRDEHTEASERPGACATCGSWGEYPVPWPCVTLQLADEALADRNDTVTPADRPTLLACAYRNCCVETFRERGGSRVCPSCMHVGRLVE